jgi:hypothetical protein
MMIKFGFNAKHRDSGKTLIHCHVGVQWEPVRNEHFMLKVNAHFKWMKDHLLFEMGEKMATQLKMDFMQWWDVNGIFLYAH